MQRFGSGARWEPVVGYSRTVRAGPFVFISGTTATLPNGSIGGEDDAYEQTRLALVNVGTALEMAGASFSDVVQTRMYVTDIDRWEEVGRAHEEVFGESRPVTSMVEVSRLIDPAMIVEIEVIAYGASST